MHLGGLVQSQFNIAWKGKPKETLLLLEAVQMNILEDIQICAEQVMLNENGDDVLSMFTRAASSVHYMLKRLRATSNKDAAYWIEDMLTKLCLNDVFTE